MLWRNHNHKKSSQCYFRLINKSLILCYARSGHRGLLDLRSEFRHFHYYCYYYCIRWDMSIFRQTDSRDVRTSVFWSECKHNMDGTIDFMTNWSRRQRTVAHILTIEHKLSHNEFESQETVPESVAETRSNAWTVSDIPHQLPTLLLWGSSVPLSECVSLFLSR